MHNSGGMEHVLSVCATALCKEIDVSIMTIYQCGRPYFYPLDKDINTFDLGLKNVSNKRLLKQRLAEFLLHQKFDIVVSLGGIDMFYLHSIKDCSKKIVWFHFTYNVAYALWLKGSHTLVTKAKGYLRHLKRIFYARQFDYVVVLSKADADLWRRHTDKVSVIYNPVTLDNPMQSSLDKKSVISVGRLDYAKGYDYLIDAWKLVTQEHPDWSLNIYGEGELRSQLQERIDKQQLSERVKLCGRTSSIGEKYAQHSMYVMSSRSEALGLVLLEASVCGLPLIAFDCPSGPREIIQDGKNGYLVQQVGDIEELAKAIDKLIEHSELRKQMGKKAFEMVEKSFSLEVIKQQWIDLINHFDDTKN